MSGQLLWALGSRLILAPTHHPFSRERWHLESSPRRQAEGLVTFIQRTRIKRRLSASWLLAQEARAQGTRIISEMIRVFFCPASFAQSTIVLGLFHACRQATREVVKRAGYIELSTRAHSWRLTSLLQSDAQPNGSLPRYPKIVWAGAAKPWSLLALRPLTPWSRHARGIGTLVASSTRCENIGPPLARIGN